MINTIRKFFKSNQNSKSDNPQTNQDELAYASLLIEVIKSDDHFDQREHDELLNILGNKLSIEEKALDELSELAQLKSDESTSLYEFTREINDKYQYEEKVQLIEDLWRIAYSDERIDKYEDYVIRKVADLIYVSHSDFIKSKLKVKDTVSPEN
tara:strand:- start:1170 stop:1631 length:462 start_codon:yes stop_codon:yes gene_type:complete